MYPNVHRSTVYNSQEETKLVRSVTLQPLVNTKFALLWIWDLGIFFLDPTYKWNHAIVVTLYLAKSLNIVSSIFIQIVANGRISSFSEMNNITLYINIGEGIGNPLQHSCLESSMDRGAWQAIVHGVAKSQTQLSDFTLLFFFLVASVKHFAF